LLKQELAYVLVHQDGIGKAPELKFGTAATAIFLHPHAPGAFDAADHTKRVAQKLRKELTTEELYKDIDWIHIHNVGALHWVRVLVQYVPRLKGHKEEIYRLFRTAPIAKCRQAGVVPDKISDLLIWIRGDGASFAAIKHLKGFLAILKNDSHHDTCIFL
jgi:hypothetical protein